jgi:tetratricopeptide (TPR) repeat protein
LDPRDAAGYGGRGEAYLKNHQPKEAIGDLSKCVEMEQKYIRCYTLRAQAYYQSGNFDAAIGDVNLVLERSRVVYIRGEALYIRGEAYRGKRNYEQAISDFTEVLAGGGREKRVESLQARAEVYLLKKDYDKAWADVQEAEKLRHPLSPEFLQKLRQASGRDH